MNRVLSTLAMLSFYLCNQAMALPVLPEFEDQNRSKFVTIYPDHLDPNLFYFLPNSIQFARDPSTNVPSFSLITYGAEQSDASKAQGWITFVFRAGITPDVQTALGEFKATHPGATLRKLPLGESYLTLGIDGDETPGDNGNIYFKSWDLPPYIDVFESEVGGNIILTGTGALMMPNAVKDVSTPWVLKYCFEVDGITPATDTYIKRSRCISAPLREIAPFASKMISNTTIN